MRLTGLTLPILLGALLLQVVTAGTKSGVCPESLNLCSENLNMDCDSDEKCNGTQKCCQGGCVYSCKDPAVIKTGRCARNPTPDPACPSVIPMKDRHCIGDQDCNGRKKCCKDGCVYSCKNPEDMKLGEIHVVPPGKLRLPCRWNQNCNVKKKEPEVIKSGDCPMSPTHSNSCSMTNTKNGNCTGDQDCYGAQKCCYYNCQYVCVDPAVTKPGMCLPHHMAISACVPWLTEGGCRSDLECDGVKKCCMYKCRHSCIDPVG